MLTFGFSVSVKDNTPVEEIARKKLGAKVLDEFVILKKSVDARKKDNINYVYKVGVRVKNEDIYISKDVVKHNIEVFSIDNMCISKKLDCRAVVVGSGPAGLFAALTLCSLGVRPVIIERGERIEDRVNSTRRFIDTLELNEESNVQFGEGGAGTFSDGKLNTGVNSDYVKAVIAEFVENGAPKEIAYLTKPHVGTDKLINVVTAIRNKIIAKGGVFMFGTRLTDIKTVGEKVTAAITNKGEIPCDRIYLAIGHSARDTFEMLYAKGVRMVPKIFSMGVRIEHLSKTINESQYGSFADFLPAADYKMAVNVGEEGSLYTFCMCPGGSVINASSEKGGICVNGMSLHARDGVNSNSALLVNVGPDDWKSEFPLAGIEYQRAAERRAFALSDSYKPIVQTVGDYLSDKEGTEPSEVKPSVETGYVLGNLRSVLPEKVAKTLKAGLPLMGRKVKKFDSPYAILTGIEARSSSPVRILRDEKCCSSMSGLYPVGEGAGYAGGITSAAADGIRAVLASCEI